MLDRFRRLFKGIDGLECERFIRNVRQRSLEEGKQRDYAWIADSVSASFDGDALRWYVGLAIEIQHDWDLLQRELLLKYPPPGSRDIGHTHK